MNPTCYPPGRPRQDSHVRRQVVSISLHPDEIAFLDAMAKMRRQTRSKLLSDYLRRMMPNK
jgi:hypothetical protein